MNKAKIAVVMDKVFEECSFLRDAGQKEYAHKDENAFRNFESVGTALDLPREKVLLTYMLKHIDGIVAHANGHTSQREDVRGRINDVIVYLILYRAMLDQDSGNS